MFSLLGYLNLPFIICFSISIAFHSFWSSCLSKPLTLEVIKEGTVIDILRLIGKPYFLIGRTPDCDVQLEHPSVSRLHAVIQSDGSQVYLYDVESTHGTFLNKTKLEPKQYYLFHTGELLRFGLSTRQFVPSYETKEEEKLLETNCDSPVSSKGISEGKESQTKNNDPISNWVGKNPQVYSEEDEEEVFETEDEERQRLEALGGFEDVLGANYGDDSDDEFYDRTKTRCGETLVKPTNISHRQEGITYNRHKNIANETIQDEEEDELEKFMKENEQTLQTHRKHSMIVSNSSIHSDATNSLKSIPSESSRSSSVEKEKEETEADVLEKNRNSRKRSRIPYGPTRASLPFLLLDNLAMAKHG
ncbi:Kanadaptin [Galdieria sulphuraria]|nr:Kanadaptin [Galdieria sulphuraria]